MGNSASNPTTTTTLEHDSRNQPSRNFSLISRTRCDAPPAAVVAPPPLPPPANPKAAPPPPAPPTTDVPTPPASQESDAIAQAAASSTRYNNPGPYEQAAMQAKQLVSLDTWEGFRCEVSKQMNPFMVVIHSFGMTPASAGGSASPMGPPPPPPTSYTMVTQVGDENGVLVSRADTARGGVDGRVQRMLLGGLAMGKLQLSLSGSENDMFLAEIDVGTAIPILTWTANLKLGSMAGGPAWGGNYWQAITPQLTMGAEGMYIGAQGATITTYAAKYTFQAPLSEEEQVEAELKKPGPPGMPQPEAPGASQLCANFHSANGMMTLNYRRVVTPSRVVVGAEMAFPLFDPLAVPPDVLLGAEFNLTRSKLHFGLDASTGKLSSSLETKLGMGPAAPRFGLCATVDHFNQDYKFGYSINIEG